MKTLDENSSELTYLDLESLALKIVPEIRQSYYEFGWDSIPYPTDEWIELLHNMPRDDNRGLGATIEFESILAPFVLSLVEDENQYGHRLRQIRPKYASAVQRLRRDRALRF